jgi:hypothetical protein
MHEKEGEEIFVSSLFEGLPAPLVENARGRQALCSISHTTRSSIFLGKNRRKKSLRLFA